jgi:hypothetical protein
MTSFDRSLARRRIVTGFAVLAFLLAALAPGLVRATATPAAGVTSLAEMCIARVDGRALPAVPGAVLEAALAGVLPDGHVDGSGADHARPCCGFCVPMGAGMVPLPPASAGSLPLDSGPGPIPRASDPVAGPCTAVELPPSRGPPSIV